MREIFELERQLAEQESKPEALEGPQHDVKHDTKHDIEDDIKGVKLDPLSLSPVNPVLASIFGSDSIDALTATAGTNEGQRDDDADEQNLPSPPIRDDDKTQSFDWNDSEDIIPATQFEPKEEEELVEQETLEMDEGRDDNIANG